MKKNFPPFGGYDDPDVKRAFKWMISFLDNAEWRRRTEQIEAQLEVNLTPHTSRETATPYKSNSVIDDRIGWYLYLIDTVLHNPVKYEPTQGARIVPIFKRLGADLDQLKDIKHVDDRVERMLTKEKQQPDGALFELLVGLIWKRNGANDVEFLNEAPPEKQPDLKASIGKNTWYIECKRLNKSSEYSQNERQKWLRMWSIARDILYDRQYDVVLDVVFHVELSSLPDDFLVKELCGKLALVNPPCTIISNEIWDVSIAPIDYDSIREHLSRFLVKYPSDQIIELIGGRREPNRGFTHLVKGRFKRLGDEIGNNRFLDEVSFAVAAYWSCDAERAVERKARDIRGHLAEAVKQLPANKPGVVHIGLETLDGGLVEIERYKRIFKSVCEFDARGKDLRWVYCHLFQSYAPPSDCWIIDETVYFFNRIDQFGLEPIPNNSAIVMKDDDTEANKLPVHWLRPTP
ncbi:hypothetical protein [Methylomonas sp. 11b]|uniref:hypothetical protein n=1 Tax=Methylomonas sp. 11b TaxID=1168169 RepID=UPI00047C809D|nr:hypothetical protein [Methylomonas sp. 11b]